MEQSIYKFTLTEDRVVYSKYFKGVYYEHDLFIIDDGLIYIKSGYSWDGCSPKWEVYGVIFGAPDFKCIYDAILVHDILFQFGREIGISMNIANRVLLDIMKQHRVWLRHVYYFLVETFGRKRWDYWYNKI